MKDLSNQIAQHVQLFISFPFPTLQMANIIFKKQRFLEMLPSSGLNCWKRWKCTAHPTLTSSIFTSLPSTGTTSPNYLPSLLPSPTKTKPPLPPRTSPLTRNPLLSALLEKWMPNPTPPPPLLVEKRETSESKLPPQKSPSPLPHRPPPPSKAEPGKTEVASFQGKPLPSFSLLFSLPIFPITFVRYRPSV